MKNKPENPLAFPKVINNNREVRWEDGMTLLDYFAAKALQGLLARDGIRGFQTGERFERNEITERAYELAQAMLKEREKHL